MLVATILRLRTNDTLTAVVGTAARAAAANNRCRPVPHRFDGKDIACYYLVVVMLEEGPLAASLPPCRCRRYLIPFEHIPDRGATRVCPSLSHSPWSFPSPQCGTGAALVFTHVRRCLFRRQGGGVSPKVVHVVPRSMLIFPNTLCSSLGCERSEVISMLALCFSCMAHPVSESEHVPKPCKRY
jgi:hypothetical protein